MFENLQDYSQLVVAIETEELYQFLKLAPPKKETSNEEQVI